MKIIIVNFTYLSKKKKTTKIKLLLIILENNANDILNDIYYNIYNIL